MKKEKSAAQILAIIMRSRSWLFNWINLGRPPRRKVTKRDHWIHLRWVKIKASRIPHATPS